MMRYRFRILIAAMFCFSLLLSMPALAGETIAPQPQAIEEEAIKEADEDPEMQKLRLESERLTLENELQTQRMLKEMAPIVLAKERLSLEHELEEAQRQKAFSALETEKAKLELDYDLLLKRQQMAAAALEIEKNKLMLEKELRDAKNESRLAEMEAQKQTLAVENELRQQQQQKEISTLQAENERFTLLKEKDTNLHERKMMKLREEIERKELELSKMELLYKEKNAVLVAEIERLGYERSLEDDKLAALNLKSSLWEQKEELNKLADRKLSYPSDPLIDGSLRISDRRIELNGPIFSSTANYVGERIHFFNNQSEERPIFIVIDRCPGGSVMAGYRILKAIESSQAPCHVVVKSFAASMAAVIVAAAEHSYAYPNAIILHHQMYGMAWGNQLQLKEELDFLKQWEKRLHGPVAKKMGISLEKFIEEMYKHSIEGDWREFADVAQTLNWVDTIIPEIREEGYSKKPEGKPLAPWWWGEVDMRQDENGRPQMALPRLGPCDFYFLYNPDRYYR